MKLFQRNKQEPVQPRQHPALYILLSFFIPFLLILVALAGLHVTPFGDKTLFIADANGLYINYVSYVGRLVKGLEGFTYSFEKGLGGNMMPHIFSTLWKSTRITQEYLQSSMMPKPKRQKKTRFQQTRPASRRPLTRP